MLNRIFFLFHIQPVNRGGIVVFSLKKQFHLYQEGTILIYIITNVFKQFSNNNMDELSHPFSEITLFSKF